MRVSGRLGFGKGVEEEDEEPPLQLEVETVVAVDS